MRRRRTRAGATRRSDAAAPRVRLRVLGAAAGGGVPQWNCGCRNCRDARAGRIAPLTQSSVAVSGDGARWLLVNASPDLRSQLASAPALWPVGLRGSPIEAVALTNGDVDHVAGLLTLRERTGFDLYATPEILSELGANPIFGVMGADLVRRVAVAPGVRFAAAGLEAELFPVPGKTPLWRESGEVKTAELGGLTAGLALRAGGRTALVIPGCAAVTEALEARLHAADLVLFDGTAWEDEEMPRLGAGEKTARRMGHLPMRGPGGSLEALAGLKARKVFIHVNNTNPVLQPGGAERRLAEAAGWEIGFDGMEIGL